VACAERIKGSVLELGAGHSDAAADLHRAREEHLRHALVLDQRAAHVARSLHDPH